MAGGPGSWWKKGSARLRRLRALVRDTQRALSDVANILTTDPAVSCSVQEIGDLASRSPALIILGHSAAARMRLLHSLIGRSLLPADLPRGCRWIRMQYGTCLQVQLSLGNSDFELLEELHCSKKPWQTLPIEDLLRQGDADLATVLDIQLNSPILKEGLKIIIPPDIDQEPGNQNMQTLKRLNQELFSKRETILKQSNPIYLYALDRIGRNIFVEQFCDSKVCSCESEDEMWTSNLYYMTRNTSGSSRGAGRKPDPVVYQDDNEPCVFYPENCLDLQQIKDLQPNSQVFFVLFHNSSDVNIEASSEKKEELLGSCRSGEVFHDATESTEARVFSAEELPESDQSLVVLRSKDVASNQAQPTYCLHEEQVAFMRELVDQWRVMSNQSSKTNTSNNWLILDDEEISKLFDQDQEKPPAPDPADIIEKEYDANNSKNEPSTDINVVQEDKDFKQQSKECNRKDTHTYKGRKKSGNDDGPVQSRHYLLNKIMKFSSETIQSYVLDYCNKLSEIHVKLLQQFILASFDLARELQVVPKKIQYVAIQEQNLFESINEKFSQGDKKQELVKVMQEVLQEMKTDVDNMDWSVDDLPYHRDKRFVISNSMFYSSARTVPEPDSILLSAAHDVEEAESYDDYNFEDYEIIHSTEESLGPFHLRDSQKETLPDSSQISNIPVENESDIFSVDSSIVRFGAHLLNGQTRCTNNTQMSIKQASLDVQKTVLNKLSRKISVKLVQFGDCLRDSYFGTLQRCLESLEMSCREELGGRPATEAMRQVLSVAKQVDLQCCASFPILRTLIESLRRLFHKLRLVSGGGGTNACCVLSPAWRRQVALHTVHSFSAHKLARIISAQILNRLSTAHERYQSALGSLETALAGRLHHTEDVKLAIRRKYAPGFARLCLESMSMCDLLMYGMPELGREIGRGQYGVVYACKGSWAGKEPCAVKSVLPADDRNYNELAMEFFYARSIPPHPRVVRLYGSLVTHGSQSAGVLLVCERKTRDLHCAVKAGLSFTQRMRISLDIVHGIRYLHSLGLVHRDIKMKNVLLDQAGRAALTDLGFCAPGALISGSVVGTPVHMAPELLAGDYDSAVDVYAFGILFWYVCAGNIKLPSAFESFLNKEQLWSKVKRGLRPERLPHFTDACWDLMESCWHSVPSRRALIGDVQEVLEKIYEDSLTEGSVDQSVGGTSAPMLDDSDF